MKLRYALLLCSLFAFPALLCSQSSSRNDEESGKAHGNYNIEQSLEFGGRTVGVGGNASVYDTFVDLHSGPRLLGQDLSMRSINHSGTLFDNLDLASFGYGGDPEASSRVQASKDNIYDFSGVYLRDHNYFDYNLLANPLNPVNPYVSSNASPHFMNTTRNMGDFDLTLFPQSWITARLGYSRSVNEGPAGLSYHEGTEILLNENFRSRADRYRFGVDLKPFASTTISFDQFFEHDKNDTTLANPLLGAFVLPNGQPVDLGQTYSPYYKEPCAAPIVSGNVVNPACNLYLSYSKSEPIRTDIPTSQLSFVSDYFKKLELSGSASYGWANSNVQNYLEQAQYFWSSNLERAFQYSGPVSTQSIQDHADFAALYRLTNQFSLSEKFRWQDWRTPGSFINAVTRCFAAAPSGTATILTPVGTPVGVPANACPALAASLGFTLSPGPAYYGGGSDPDVGTDRYLRFLGQNLYSNTFMLHWDPMSKFGAHAGYRYGSRRIQQNLFDHADDWGSTVASNPAPGETITPPVDQFTTLNTHEHTALIGLLARPLLAWNINADAELTSADHPVILTVAGTAAPADTDWTAALPRHTQKVKIRTSYRASSWLTVTGAVNLAQNRNDAVTAFPSDVPASEYSNHTRAYNLGVSVRPEKRVGLTAGWTYVDLHVNAPTCLPLSSGGGLGVMPLGGALPSCTTGVAALPVVLSYQDRVNGGYGLITLKPVKRVMFDAGYDLTSSSGYNDWLRADTLAPLLVPANASGLVLLPSATGYPGNAAEYVSGPNPLVPLGPLGVNWHKPAVSCAIEMAKGVTLKGAYNYYGYNEKSDAGPVSARDFHANTATLSVKYSF